jgi:hypothetical protein
MRINKHYYEFTFGGYCGVLVSEETMKKIAKLQYETNQKLLSILEISKDVHPYGWSIADEPIEMSQDDRTFYYIDDSDSEDLERRLEHSIKIFDIRHIKNLYDLKGKYIDSVNAGKKEHEEHLRNLQAE